jgi:WD40 repeat protein
MALPVTKTVRVVAAEGAPGESAQQTDLYGDPLPVGAVARIGSLRFRTRGAVEALAFSPDGKLIASAGNGDALRVWDASTGQLYRSLPGPRAINFAQVAVAFLPEGKRLAVGPYAEGKFRIWNLERGAVDVRIGAADAEVALFAMSLDGEVTATADSAHVRVWRASTGREVTRFPAAELHIRWLALSPRGDLLAAAEPSAVTIWDIATGRAVWKSPAGRVGIHSALFSSDGHSLIWGTDDGLVLCWDLRTRKQSWELRVTKSRRLHTLALSSDSKWLAAAGEGDNPAETHMSLWDLPSQKRLWHVQDFTYRLTTLTFSPDGTVLATGSTDPFVRFWDVRTGHEMWRLHGHAGPITALVFAPDGRSVFTGGSDEAVFAWDPISGRELQQLVPRRGAGRRLALTALKMVRIKQPGEERFVWDPGRAVRALVLADSNKLLACLSADAGVRTWHLATGSRGPDLALPTEDVGAATTMAGSPTSPRIAIGTRSPRRITIWDPEAKEVLRTLETASLDDKQILQRPKPAPTELRLLAFSPTGALLSSAAMASTGLPCVEAWDTASGKKRYSLTLHRPVKRTALPAPHNPPPASAGEYSWPSVVVFSPTGGTLACGYQDGSVCLWDFARRTGCCALAGDGAPVLALTFSPDARMLASGTKDGTIRLWELASGGQRCSFRCDQCPVSGLAFSPDGLHLASTREDGTGLIWPVLDAAPAQRGLGEGPGARDPSPLWNLLAADAPRAYRAMRVFLADPDVTVGFIRGRLRPAAPWPGSSLIQDLDSPSYRTRERAADELHQLGPLAVQDLEKALRQSPSAEVRHQAQRLLESMDGRVRAPELLRTMRAIELLERIGTTDARAVLVDLARSADPSPLADEARAAARRLDHRSEQAGP